MNRLDVDRDYETVIENGMLAGTHLLNAILHALGVTPEDKDVLHSNKPEIQYPDNAELLAAARALKYIEDLRPHHVRGVDPYTPEVGRSTLEAYQTIKQLSVKTVK